MKMGSTKHLLICLGLFFLFNQVGSDYVKTIERTDCMYGKGEFYNGDISVTEGGKTCTSWTSSYIPSYWKSKKFIDGSLAAAGNKCRNPEGLKRLPFCILVVDGKSRGAYCIIPLCKPDPDDCMTGKGEFYGGCVSVTESGRTCTSWTSPPASSWAKRNFIDGSVEVAGHKCRNPEGRKDRPFCYTTDPEKEWEYCDIPHCPKDCIYGKGFTYTGDTAVTQSGQICKPWSSDDDYRENWFHIDGSKKAAENKCRNPKPSTKDKPFCLTDDAAGWEYCDLPQCYQPAPNDCYDHQLFGETYMGDVFYTKKGYTCQAWASQEPHKHKYTSDDDFFRS